MYQIFDKNHCNWCYGGWDEVGWDGVGWGFYFNLLPPMSFSHEVYFNFWLHLVHLRYES